MRESAQMIETGHVSNVRDVQVTLSSIEQFLARHLHATSFH
jgi:hypothetical protein